MVRGLVVAVVMLVLAGCPGYRIIHVVSECEGLGGCPEDGGGSGGGSGGGAPGEDGGGASTGPFNIMFGTRGTYPPGSFGDGDGGVPIADAICAADAKTNGYPGHFIAALSTSKRDLRSRIPPGVRGWTLPPTYGAPADAERIIDVIGEPWAFGSIPATTFNLATGSTDLGAFKGPACDDWTSNSPSLTYRVGSSHWYPGMFDAEDRSCDTAASLLCLQIDYQAPMARVVSPSVPRTFVTIGMYTPGRGQAGFDQDCANEAARAGLSGTFQAYVATESFSAMKRFLTVPGTYHRLDGVPVGLSAAFLARAPVQVTADVRLLVPDGGVWPDSPLLLPTDTAMWTGAWDEAAAGTGSSCTDWFSTAGTGYVRDALDVTWGRTERSCAGAAHVACVEVR
jgi:hypothetical protein